jgi:diguanylate cyclase (GGDEF)-like protein
MNLNEAIEQLERFVADARQASLTDEMTKLGSKLALDQEQRLISEGMSEFDVAVFGDLDDFKHLNDDHGHDAGDVAINKAGETIQLVLVIEGLQAKAFRRSGDEFVILLKQDSIETFLLTTPSFSNITFFYNEQELGTAMSLGYAIGDGKISVSDLLGRAEVACQYAKVQGGGVCVAWTEDMKLNPLVRKNGNCLKCSARISCNVPKLKAPAGLKFCPCCGESL